MISAINAFGWRSGWTPKRERHANRFVAWTKPDTTSLLLRTLTDLARSKSELVAENALHRQQRIILRRQVKRPACTKADRMLLVLLARAVRTWKQALFIVRPETLLRGHRQGFQLYWKYTSRAAVSKPKRAAETVALIKEMVSEESFGCLASAFDVCYQNKRKRSRCQRSTVSGCTMKRALLQVRTIRANSTKRNRSVFLQTGPFYSRPCNSPWAHRSLSKCLFLNGCPK